jgi:hypothetical protein
LHCLYSTHLSRLPSRWMSAVSNLWPSFLDVYCFLVHDGPSCTRRPSPTRKWDYLLLHEGDSLMSQIRLKHLQIDAVCLTVFKHVRSPYVQLHCKRRPARSLLCRQCKHSHAKSHSGSHVSPEKLTRKSLVRTRCPEVPHQHTHPYAPSASPLQYTRTQVRRHGLLRRIHALFLHAPKAAALARPLV